MVENHLSNMKRSIHQHINSNKDELCNPQLSSQRRRHLESELNSLERYQKNHPDEDYDPTPLELYCDEHLDAQECRIYED